MILQSKQRYIWYFHNKKRDPAFGYTSCKVIMEVISKSKNGYLLKPLQIIGGDYYSYLLGKKVSFPTNRFSPGIPEIESWTLLSNQDKPNEN